MTDGTPGLHPGEARMTVWQALDFSDALYRRYTAVHEAGHAIVALATQNATVAECVLAPVQVASGTGSGRRLHVCGVAVGGRSVRATVRRRRGPATMAARRTVVDTGAGGGRAGFGGPRLRCSSSDRCPGEPAREGTPHGRSPLRSSLAGCGRGGRSPRPDRKSHRRGVARHTAAAPRSPDVNPERCSSSAGTGRPDSQQGASPPTGPVARLRARPADAVGGASCSSRRRAAAAAWLVTPGARTEEACRAARRLPQVAPVGRLFAISPAASTCTRLAVLGTPAGLRKTRPRSPWGAPGR